MATEIALPQWGMEMQDGTVVKWLKNEGDPVEQGEPLVEIETAKLTTEMESTASGVLAHILVNVGETVPVRAVLAIVAAPGDAVPRPQRAAPPSATSAATAPTQVARPPAGRPSDGRPSAQVTPVARRLAKEHGVDLDTVQGTGPRGRITDADVRGAIEGAPATAPAPDVGIPVAKVVPLSGVRGAIARRMHQSAQSAAGVTLTTEADVTDLVSLQRRLVAEWRTHRLRPMETELIVKAVARALKGHPRLNAVLVDNEVRELSEVNVGVAMALPEGLVVPVVRNADQTSLLEIARAVRGRREQVAGGRAVPAGDDGRHLHDHRPGGPGHRRLYPNNQSASGRDPGGGSHGGKARRPQGRGRPTVHDAPEPDLRPPRDGRRSRRRVPPGGQALTGNPGVDEGVSVGRHVIPHLTAQVPPTL